MIGYAAIRARLQNVNDLPVTDHDLHRDFSTERSAICAELLSIGVAVSFMNHDSFVHPWLCCSKLFENYRLKIFENFKRKIYYFCCCCLEYIIISVIYLLFFFYNFVFLLIHFSLFFFHFE